MANIYIMTQRSDEGRKMREETYSHLKDDKNFFANPSHHNTFARETPKPKNNNYGKVALAVLGATALGGLGGLGGSYLYTMSRLENQIKPQTVKKHNFFEFSKQRSLSRKVFLNPLNYRKKRPTHTIVEHDDGSYQIFAV